MSTEFEPPPDAAPDVWARIEAAARRVADAADYVNRTMGAVMTRLAGLDLPVRAVTAGRPRALRLAAVVGAGRCEVFVVTPGRRRLFHEAPLADRMAAVALVPALLEAVAAAVEADAAALVS